MSVRKAVLVAAGYGTRFLPVTRVVPKELLPLVDRPAIDFVVQEFADAGVTDLLVITSRRKKALDDWFDRDVELETVFEREGADHKLAKARPPALRVQFVRQHHMGGTGDALLLARAFAGHDPFLVAFPDDLFGPPNVSAQLVAAHEATGCSVMAAADLSGHDVSRYGVFDATEEQAGRHRVHAVVEKPAPGTEPSHLISLGRYLYTPELWEPLARHRAAHEGPGEYFPMKALAELAGAGRLVAQAVPSERRDTGAPLGYLKAVFDEALSRPELAAELVPWMRQRIGEEGE